MYTSKLKIKTSSVNVWRSTESVKKYCLKVTLNHDGIAPCHLERLASDRADWCTMCKSTVQDFEAWHINKLEANRDLCMQICSATHQQLSVPGLQLDVSVMDWTHCHNTSHSSWWEQLHRQFNLCICLRLLLLLIVRVIAMLKDKGQLL